MKANAPCFSASHVSKTSTAISRYGMVKRAGSHHSLNNKTTDTSIGKAAARGIVNLPVKTPTNPKPIKGTTSIARS